MFNLSELQNLFQVSFSFKENVRKVKKFSKKTFQTKSFTLDSWHKKSLKHVSISDFSNVSAKIEMSQNEILSEQVYNFLRPQPNVHNFNTSKIDHSPRSVRSVRPVRPVWLVAFIGTATFRYNY